MEFNCRGGPMHALPLLRRPERGAKGVLLVDREGGTCWIYDWDPESQTFACRQEAPYVLSEDPDDLDNRWRAAEEFDFDVIAVPFDGGYGRG